jgi:hypothetical protein
VTAQHLQAGAGIPARTVAGWWCTGLAGVDVLVLEEASLPDDRDRGPLAPAAAPSSTGSATG